jgi:hypothetical protein
MQSNADVPRIPFRRQVYCGENGEVYLSVSGESGLNYARVYAPSSEEIRSMLLQLRRRQRWSRAHLAAVLGISKHVLRRWEDGSRRPCGSAKKLIWFVHTLFFHPELLLKDLDSLILWGRGSEEALVYDAGES